LLWQGRQEEGGRREERRRENKGKSSFSLLR
jgi:hypothetical protein